MPSPPKFRPLSNTEGPAASPMPGVQVMSGSLGQVPRRPEANTPRPVDKSDFFLQELIREARSSGSRYLDGFEKK